jgi:tRNA(Ile)-lysidine synthase
MILSTFKSFILANDLCTQREDIMLAVSGGIDSVVMTDLFYRAGYKCSILHCNFNLRGEESDGDEAFVRSLASSYDMPVYVQRFETEDYSREEGISIQMAARKLRYDWFDEISHKHRIDVIATAHNMNDSIETVLINMNRGTGIKGLTGIPVKNANYIRPILNITRKEIVEYLRETNLLFREDSSNASKKYRRNKIRHDVIPVLEEMNPAFVKTMYENMSRIAEGYEILQETVASKRKELFIKNQTHYQIDVSILKCLTPLSTWLYELFSVYNFSKDQCASIELILDSDSGKQFVSTTHRLYKDRDHLLLIEVEDESFERYYIDSPGSKVSLPFAMDIDLVEKNDMGELPDSQLIAYLDFEKLSFPLTIRKWLHGDHFYPLGMEKMKKISDFFIDTKIPVPLKKRTWILASGNKIVWIMGQRIDDRYKITDKTRQVFKLHLYE